MFKSKEKKERALGVRLGLKAERCNSPKCAMVRRPNRPGIHGGKRKKQVSEFGQQLAEKQKIVISYGLKEAQMRGVFQKALKKKESVSDTIISLLEGRLDNVVYRLGFAPSRICARQYVSHGHLLVNGRKVTIPSYQVKVGNIIKIRPESANKLIFKNVPENIKTLEAPTWLSIDKDKIEGTIRSLPYGVEIPFDINLVVDFYSK
ncbi:30S ribosomal protein S4 [Candidatus Wolfebacteria bacterium CG10_big_fil_rev_8_21_14_0_10_31_9]|uniref:Small ribosomal subunit protein uS4 n=1 Tax=Candidatus Wolfebacteria bacterium CG10_big_fil_rev_8_21_14_0_10_31_9 TaxID=1975070 RepID=A0A2H0RBW7_9BACT|nr:MAG: 30S ribosomal protein S4 [Candidatus Wolfebacteria bacterium CG10_big_fil_rev_8_21_14_0_10_31_9]